MLSLKKFLFIATLLLVSYFLIASIIIITSGISEEKSLTSKYALILGNKIEETGEPSKRLKARLDRAILLYNEGMIQIIIVSGGIGKEGFDEGKVMKNYLVKNNILESSIIEDSLGSNTENSAKNLQNILNSNYSESILIISQYFHLPRAKALVYKKGFSNVKTSYARYIEIRDVYSILRETIAFPKVILFD